MRSGRRWWWVAAGGVLVFAALLVAVPEWLDRSPPIPPRSVGDQSFTSRAEAVCAREMPSLRRDRPEAREETGSPSAFARRIDAAADGLERVARELRDLPVAAPDAAEVDRWLDDWDAYVTLGRRYADRVRASDDKAFSEVGKQAAPLSTRIFVFARSNDMPSCAL